MKLLSIFTPTFNRSYILPKLYESLKVQTDKRFEWIIVDDGSTDETERLIHEWQNLGLVKIIYKKQTNQGKHIAINSGVSLANGELFFIVDSDDNLTPDAVEKIHEFWDKNQAIPNISGILSYRQFPNKKIVGSYLPDNVKRCKLRDCSRLYNSSGDKVVIYRTEIFKKYPFPQFKGERFLGESYVFNQIDDIYDMLVMNDRIYNFAYQADGLSQDFRKLYRENPNGMMLIMLQSMNYTVGFKDRLKNAAHIGCLSIHLKKTKVFFHACNIRLGILAFPVALFLYYRIFIKKVSDVKPFIVSEE